VEQIGVLRGGVVAQIVIFFTSVTGTESLAAS